LKSNCYHKEGHEAPCKYGDAIYMILFGLVQVIMSFIPDLHNLALLSVVAAVMSFTYSTIGLGLGVTNVLGKVHFDLLRLYFLIKLSLLVIRANNMKKQELFYPHQEDTLLNLE